MSFPKLRILHLEDNSADADLQNEFLEAEGFMVESARVDTREDFVTALERGSCDIILADNSMPGFDGLSALAIANEKAPNLPFIFVSGTLGEEVAIESLKNGATDYVLKQRLVRLAPVVRRALKETEIRREHKRAQEERDRLFNYSIDLLCISGFDGYFKQLNPAWERTLGWTIDELLAKPYLDFVHPEDRETTLKTVGNLVDGRLVYSFDNRFLCRDNAYKWLSWTSYPLAEENSIFSVARDITERKKAEEEIKYHARLLRHINDAVIATDNQFCITAWNWAAESIYGWTTAEVMGRDVAEILGTGLNDRQRAEAKKLLKENGSSRSERIHSKKNGQTVYVEENTIALIDEHGKIGGYVSVNRDITERKQAEEKVMRHLHQLQALHKIDQAIASSFDLNITLQVLLDQVKAELNVDAANILLFNRHTQTLDPAFGLGFRSKALEQSHIRLGEGLAGQTALEQQVILVPDLSESHIVAVRAALFAEEGFISYAAAPLLAKGELVGILEIFVRYRYDPDENWLKLFEILASQAAVAVDNAHLLRDLQRSNMELFLAYDSTIEGWSRALDLRDKETEGHSRRVTEMTENLARAMGMNEEQLVHVRRGALLHDIGKMGIPDSILLKPDKLTDEEWVAMHKHPTFAFKLLSPIPYLRPALDIPYCHHEKWDGSGYPRGLKGEQIPLAARLFAVVDVYDALRSDRPYRPGWPRDKVLEHIRAESGAHFDPNAVELFLRMMSEQTAEDPGTG